jgi:hypothetical protein
MRSLRNQILRVSFVLGAVCTLAGSASADLLFDLENQPTSSPPSGNGVLTSLTLTGGGLTIDVTRPGSTFDIVDLTSFSGPIQFGRRTLSPFATETSATPFVFNFSHAIAGFGFSFGDFGADSDVLTLNVYSGPNGTGSLLGTVSDNYGTKTIGSGQIDAVSIGAAGINSAVFIGGSTDFPNSLYYDNFLVNPVPEPLGAVTLLIGLVGAAGISRLRAGSARASKSDRAV